MKKKLLSVVLSLAVAFTFSFAAVGTASAGTHIHTYKATGDVVWSEDFSAATVEAECVKGDSTVTANLDVEWAPVYDDEHFTGIYKVTATPDPKDALVWECSLTNNVAYVEDLNGAELTVKATDADVYAAYLKDKAAGGKAVNPMAYDLKVVDKNAEKPALAEVNCPVFNNQNLVLSDVAYEKYDEGEFDVTLAAKENPTYTWFEKKGKKFVKHVEPLNVLGSVDAKAFIYVDVDGFKTIAFTYGLDGFVEDGEAVVKEPKWDKCEKVGTFEFTYDGAAHSIVVAEKKNITTKFVVSDKELTAKDLKDAETTDTATVKDAGKYYIYALTEFNYDGGKYVKKYVEAKKFEVTVNPKKVDAWFTQEEVEFFLGDDIEGALAGLVETKNVVEGDSLNISFHQIPTAVGKGTVSLAINNDNYALKGKAPRTIKVIVKEAKEEPAPVIEENWIDAPAQAKIIHVKKNKKTTKNYTVQLKAESKFGVVGFEKNNFYGKIKVANDGKVTIKKGLRKGTYVIKIKCFVDGTDEYEGVVAYKTFRVKVTK